MKEHSRPEIVMNPTIAFHRVTRLEITPLLFYPAGSQPGFWAREIIVTDEAGKSQRMSLYATDHPALTLPHEVTPLCPEQTHGD